MRYTGTVLRHLALLITMALWSPAIAGEPVAIVEDIDAPGVDVQPFDYVEAGRVIELGDGGWIILGYITSCQRESVTGGVLTVGPESSTVAGGTVERERVECDGGNVQLTKAQAGKSGVLVFRVPGATGASNQPKPKITVYATSPVIDVRRNAQGAGGQIVIERVDRPPETHALPVSGGLVDLAKQGVALHPGGVYTARAGDAAVTFKVDDYAVPGGGSVISRLVRF